MVDEVIDWLVWHGACDKALDWVSARPHATLEELWWACPRDDWTAWVAERVWPDSPHPYSGDRTPTLEDLRRTHP